MQTSFSEIRSVIAHLSFHLSHTIMSCFNLSFDVTRCLNFCGKELDYSLRPRKNESKLRRQMDMLRKAKEAMKREVQEQEQERAQPRMVCRTEVRTWMDSVDSLDGDVVQLLDALATSRCCSSCCSCFSNHNLGKSVVEMLEQISVLDGQRKEFGEKLVKKAPPDPIAEVPSSLSSIVGGDRALLEIREHLKDDQVRVIGIYGMGGIGKTTLLAKINNELLHNRTRNLDLVIWLTVSKDVDIHKIQNQISDRMGISFTSEEEDQRANIIFQALSRKRFLLFFDDIWERLDMGKIGVPVPSCQNEGKILFTTRSEQVCVDMDAQKRVRVGFLNPTESWELFQKKVCSDVVVNNPSIRSRAEVVVAKCGGLPLAIITVGRAVANYTTIGEWDDVIEDLKSSPTEIRGMDDLMTLLKFSYDRLEDEKTKSCFLACSMYPEDHNVFEKYLISRWVGEGFLDIPHKNDFGKAYNKGLVILRKLRSACLLESSTWGDSWVKMHDAVRDMALWITRGENIVYDKSSCRKMFSLERWKTAKWVSLMNCDIECLPELEVPDCPNLVTLFLSKNYRMETLSFFLFMPLLRFLDVSDTQLKEIPNSIGMLVELRCLKLSHTPIQMLPSELGNLSKLQQLDLCFTPFLKIVPRDAITRLSTLQYLEMSGSGYEWDPIMPKAKDDGLSNIPLLKLEDLEGLENLQELGMDVISIPVLQAMLNSKVLATVANKLSLNGFDPSISHLQLALARFSKAAILRIQRCSQLQELRLCGGQLLNFEVVDLEKLSISKIILEDSGGLYPLQNLRRLFIDECPCLKDFTWLTKLPYLEFLYIQDCNMVEELIMDGEKGDKTDESEEDNRSHFRRLQYLHLEDLPNLSRISTGQHSLMFPSLKGFYVVNCPMLRRLPFGLHSAKNIQQISGSREWWDGLDWDQEDIKSILLPHFLDWQSSRTSKLRLGPKFQDHWTRDPSDL